MGTEAIKVVTTTSDKGVKTTTFTQTVKDKTSVFTMIDHNKDGKYDGFTLKGSFDTADLQNALKTNAYQEGEKATIVDEKGETVMLPDADKNISEGKEYNIGSLAKRLATKPATESQSNTDAQNSYNPGPGFSVDNNILQNSFGMCSNMLSQMIYQALNGADNFLPNRMQNFAQLVWNSAGPAYKVNPYTPPPAKTNSDGTVNTDSSTSGSQSAADGTNSSVIETDQEVAAKQAAQDAKDKEADKAIEKQHEEEKAKKVDEANKKAKTAALCKDLMLSMKGLNFDKSKLEAAVNQINKDNVVEVLEEWETRYKSTMDNQSLIQCIHNDNYFFRSQTQYTNKIKDALKARLIELELGSDAEAFDANVTYENNCPWYLGGTSNSKVEAEFDEKYKLAKAKRDEKAGKPAETTESTETKESAETKEKKETKAK